MTIANAHTGSDRNAVEVQSKSTENFAVLIKEGWLDSAQLHLPHAVPIMMGCYETL